MTEKNDETEKRAGLNPALKERRETTHETARESPAPADTTSVKGDSGRLWPIIWAVVTVVCVVIVILLFI